MGFEPTVPLPVHQLSGLANSATLAPLRVAADPECYPDAGRLSRRVAGSASDVARRDRSAANLRIRCSGRCKSAAGIVAERWLRSGAISLRACGPRAGLRSAFPSRTALRMNGGVRFRCALAQRCRPEAGAPSRRAMRLGSETRSAGLRPACRPEAGAPNGSVPWPFSVQPLAGLRPACRSEDRRSPPSLLAYGPAGWRAPRSAGCRLRRRLAR